MNLLWLIIGGSPYEVVKPFFAEIIAAIIWVYNWVLTILVAGFGINVTIAEAIIAATVAYGLYRLGRQDPVESSIDARKIFQLRPNPPRMVVYGKCWLAPTIVSQTSDENDLHLICAVADHKLKSLNDVKVNHQNFFSSDELNHLITKQWGLFLGSQNGDVSPVRKAIRDANHYRYHETENNFSYHPFLFITYGFGGENMSEQLKTLEENNLQRCVPDPGRGWYCVDHFLPIKAGPGYGTDISNYNMRMDGVSWTTISLKRLSKQYRPAWPFWPNFSYNVTRGNENLNVAFLWKGFQIYQTTPVEGEEEGFSSEDLDLVRARHVSLQAHKTKLRSLRNDAYAALKAIKGSATKPVEYVDLEQADMPDVDADKVKTLNEKKKAIFDYIITTLYTEGNAALCIADFLNSYTSYREKVCGESRIDVETTLKAAYDCEVNQGVDGPVPLTANGAMQIQRPDAVLQQLTMAMNGGAITESGGIRYIHCGKRPKRTIKITEEDLAVNKQTGNASTVMARTSDVSKRASALDLIFIDSDEQSRSIGLRYRSPSGAPQKRTTNIAMQFAFIDNAAQAEQVGRMTLDRQWSGSALSFTLLNVLKTPKPYDMVEMDIPSMASLPSKLFRVTGVNNSLNGQVKVEAVNEPLNLYEASHTRDFSILPDPDYSLEEILLKSDDDEPDNLVLIHPETADANEKDQPGGQPITSGWGDQIRIN